MKIADLMIVILDDLEVTLGFLSTYFNLSNALP